MSTICIANVTTCYGSFEVSKIRMHDDLMQEGLLKKDKKAASFVTIAEPDISVIPAQNVIASEAKQSDKRGKSKIASVVALPRNDKGTFVQVQIRGLDIYDPIKDEVKKGRKITVRVISRFGEESMKVIQL